MSRRWLSRDAVLWVLYEAPDVPPHLVAALIAIAVHSDAHGHGSYPSAETVAAMIRKSVRNTRKDIAALRHLKLLLEGDQRLVMDIRPDRRPFVFDLPMSRGVADDTSSARSRGVAQDPAGCRTGPSGVSSATPKEDLKRSGKRGARGPKGPPLPLPEKPPWCGHCDERTRQRESDDGRPGRCPDCHPLRSAS